MSEDLKKADKTKGKLFDAKINITIDEKLSHLEGKILAPRKLEQANESLKRIKSLPKV